MSKGMEEGFVSFFHDSNDYCNTIIRSSFSAEDSYTRQCRRKGNIILLKYALLSADQNYGGMEAQLYWPPTLVLAVKS
jgi:hypothetical protein